MQNNYTKMIGSKLFNDVSEKDFKAMLACLSAFEKSYTKNEVILKEGDTVNFVGAVLEGSVRVIKTDYDGNETILLEVFEGDIFGEVLAYAEILKSPVSIIATAQSSILFFDYRKIIRTCNASCVFHQKLIANMLNVVAIKSLYLHRRIDIISKKSLRDKILTYFHYESMGREHFSIAMNREELANFLCADRSALSNELSKMKKDGLIDYNRNEFTLYHS